MTPCELTASITALANLLAARMTDEQLGLLAAQLTQLGDTLGTIAAYRSLCGSSNCPCEAPQRFT